MSFKHKLFYFLFTMIIIMLFLTGVSIGSIITKIMYTGFVSINEELFIINLAMLSVVFTLLTGFFVCYYAKKYIRLIKFNKENEYKIPNFVWKEDEKTADNLIEMEKPKQGSSAGKEENIKKSAFENKINKHSKKISDKHNNSQE